MGKTLLLTQAALLLVLTLMRLGHGCPTSGSDITLSSVFGIGDTTLTKAMLSNCPRDATSIDLSYNHFTSIDRDSLEDFYGLTKITLTGNKIEELKIGLLDQPFKSALREFAADQNEITYLNNSLFENNWNLERINLAENKINFIDTNVFHKDLTKLELVNASFNELTYFEPWPYVPKTPQDDNIDVTFDFQHNLISTFTNTMNWTYDLIEPYEHIVNLQFNNLSQFDNELLFQYRKKLEGQSVLTELMTYDVNITNNPFFCDCRVYDLVKDLHSSFFLYYRVDEYRYRCSSPSHLNGIDFLHDLDLDQFVCNITNKCPSNCTCEEHPHMSTLVINCTNANLHEIPQTIPDMSHNIQYVSLYLEGNKITEIIGRNYSNIIKNLTVANNRLNYIDGEAIKSMENLENIDISGNKLKYIPKEVQKLSFDKVALDGNSFECDCNMTWMSEWISLSNGAKDSGISCSFDGKSKTIKDITEDILKCNIENFIIIFTVVTTVIVGIVVGIIVTAKRCPYETKVLIYRVLGTHPRDLYKIDEEEGMVFDAYLSYDGEDIQVRQWIKTVFMKKLEENGKKKYSFFCPQRDALGGEDYGDDLVAKMTRCRRIFVLLSPGYFKDSWRVFESDQAELEHNANEDTHPRVIYMIWNDKNETIIKNLEEEPWKSRLVGKRVLSPDERFFWSKVRYELPIKPKNKQNRVNNSFADIADVVKNEKQPTMEPKFIYNCEIDRPKTAGECSCNDLNIEEFI